MAVCVCVCEQSEEESKQNTYIIMLIHIFIYKLEEKARSEVSPWTLVRAEVEERSGK